MLKRPVMKQLVEETYVNWHRDNFTLANWPTFAEVKYASGRVKRVKIESRDLTRFCDLKTFMLSLLAASNARHVICSDSTERVYCTAIKIAVPRGGKGYKA